MSTARFQGEHNNKLILPAILILTLLGGFLLWRYLNTENKNNNSTANSSSINTVSTSSSSAVQPLYSLNEVFSESPASLNNKFVDLANVRVVKLTSDNTYLLSSNSTSDTRTILVKYSPLLLPNQSKLQVGEQHNVYGQLLSMPSREQLSNVWNLKDIDIEKAMSTVYYIEAIGISSPSLSNSNSSACPQ